MIDVFIGNVQISYQTVGATVHIVGFAISESDWEPK